MLTAPSGTAHDTAPIEKGTSMGTQYGNVKRTWVRSTSAATHAFTADLSFEPKRPPEPPL